ncbi:hypothetical protein ABK040_005993 [Willaertia magna]
MSFRKVQVLSLYKKLLKQSELLTPLSKRENIINEIKTTFRKNKEETDVEQIKKYIKQAEDKYGYLCMITPKRKHAVNTDNKGVTKLIKVGDEWMDQNEVNAIITKQDKATWKNWGMGNVDPDQLKRHEYLLKRQYFQEGPMRGYKPLWEQ